MRGLYGDFTTMPIKDVVDYLGNKRASGTLNVERHGIKKQVVIREGAVIRASSNQPREYLGQYLLNTGKVTEEQLEKAYQTQKETRIPLGKIIVMIGLVAEETVITTLNMKFREALLTTWHWDEGTFAFDADLPVIEDDGLAAEVDLGDIHREGEFRETAWEAIHGAFPSGSARLEFDEDKLPELPKPGSLDERLVAAARRGLTIDEILEELKANDFFLYQRLYALYRLDAVRPVEASEDEEGGFGDDDEPLSGMEVFGDEQSEAEIADHAERLVAQGNYRDAETLARRAHELAPSVRNTELLRRAEAGLARMIRDELQIQGVPELVIPPAKLKTMSLSAPERYLLSRVDGTRDIASLIQISPIQELDALKLFQRFVETGLIRMTSQ